MHSCTQNIHIYILTYIHRYIHTYMHSCIHSYIHTDIHTHIHTYIHTYTHAYIHTYIHIYVHNAYTHTFMHTKQTCIPIYIQRYIIQTQKHKRIHNYTQISQSCPAYISCKLTFHTKAPIIQNAQAHTSLIVSRKLSFL